MSISAFHRFQSFTSNIRLKRGKFYESKLLSRTGQTSNDNYKLIEFSKIDFLCMEPVQAIVNMNASKARWDLSNKNITPHKIFELLEKIGEQTQSSPLYLNLDDNRLGTMGEEGFHKVFERLCEPKLHHVSVRFGYDIFIPDYNKAYSKMSSDKKDILANRVHVDIHWDSPILRSIQTYIQKMDESNQSLRGWQRHYDDSFEAVITRCVKKYEEEILGNTVEYLVDSTAILNRVPPDLCEVDGLLFRMVDNEVVAIIVIEAKENIDEKMLKRANESYRAFEDYIRGLNEVQLTKEMRKNYRVQVGTFKSIIDNKTDIEIVKYLGAQNWPITKKGQSSRDQALEDGWKIVELSTQDMYEVYDKGDISQIEI